MKKYLKLFILLIGFMACSFVHAETEITFDSTRRGITDNESYYITNKAIFTVNNVVSTDSFKAYKILDAYYNENANTITYDFTNDFQAYLKTTTDYKDLTSSDYYSLSSGSLTSGSTLTSSTLDKLVSGYASYIKTNNVSGSLMNVSGNTASLSLEAGSYLILPVSTTKVYSVMVGNLDFTAEDEKYWNLNDETIVAKVSEAKVEKYVDDNKDSADHSIGEIYTYTIKATVIQYPTNATNKTFKIVDTLDKSITLTGINTIIVKDGDTLLTTDSGVIKNVNNKVVATITYGNNILTMDFNVDNLTSTNITITYNASLNTSLNEKSYSDCSGSKNKVKLIYSNDPYGTGTYETEEKETTVYTHWLQILKFEGNDQTKVLSGAKFEIYSDAELKNKIGEMITGEDGIATYNGIKGGTYYLKEASAPSGYRKINDILTADIKKESCLYRIHVSNTKNGLLPFTGGSGSSSYIVIGGIIIFIGTCSMIYYRKKNMVTNE